MKWNPFVNAALAAAYVWSVVLLMSHIASLHRDTPDNAVGTAAALSLLVLSASVMAFLFFYRPVTLLLEGKRKEAVSFFILTVLAFGAMTAAAILALL